MMKNLLILTILLLPYFTVAQAITGVWEGIITQDEGGLLGKYDLTLALNADKNGNIEGTAYVETNEMNIYVMMNIEGTFDGKTLELSDTEIIKEKKIEGINWCNKSYILTFKDAGVFRLEGDWTGYATTGTCIPGKIYLTKSKPRV